MNDAIQKYHPIMVGVSKKFAANYKECLFEVEDYYQECILILKSILEDNEYNPDKASFEQYLSSCLNNRLKNLVYNNISVFCKTEYTFRLWIKIKELEEQNLSLEEILKELDITYQQYLLSTNLKNTWDISDIDVSYDERCDNDINDLLEFLSENLNDIEKSMLQGYIQGKDIREMSEEFNTSYEGTRKRLIRIFAKIKRIYDESSTNN